MKKLFILLGLVVSIIFIVMACQKDSVLSDPNADGSLKAKMDKIWICHLDEYGNWIMIHINMNAWPAHMAHGDKPVFPNVGTWEWVYTLGGSNYIHTMYVTSVTETSFTGNGFYNINNLYTWDIVDGVISQPGNYSFTIDYTGLNPNYYLDCVGYYNCDEDGWGTATPGTGTWTLTYVGPLP